MSSCLDAEIMPIEVGILWKHLVAGDKLERITRVPCYERR